MPAFLWVSARTQACILYRMNTVLHLLCAGLACLLPLAGQEQEPVVAKETLSVHTVERGNMRLFEGAVGSIRSLHPPRAAMVFSDDHAARCEPGRNARVQIDASPRPVAGKVVKGPKEGSEAGGCEVELSDAVPAGTMIGQKVGALIEVGELTDVVFFGRPAGSSANSVATIFVLEPGSAFARRATVRYGKMSGPLIQVVEGLGAGDRVIVTDMSKWAGYPRVRIR